MIIMALFRKKTVCLEPLKPLEAQEALNMLIDHLLGDDWYCVDPLGPKQVNAVAVDEIIRKYPKKKRIKISLVDRPNRK